MNTNEIAKVVLKCFRFCLILFCITNLTNSKFEWMIEKSEIIEPLLKGLFLAALVFHDNDSYLLIFIIWILNIAISLTSFDKVS